MRDQGRNTSGVAVLESEMRGRKMSQSTGEAEVLEVEVDDDGGCPNMA